MGELISLHPHQQPKVRLTGCREHLVSRKHGVCSCHKTHHLFGFAQLLSSGGKAYNRLRKYDPSGSNGSEHSWERHRLDDFVNTSCKSAQG